MSCTGCDYSFVNCSPLKIKYPGGKPEEHEQEHLISKPEDA